MTIAAELKPDVSVRTKLPDKLSELVRLALHDFRTIDRTKFTPDSSCWLMKADQRRCVGCLAGIVMLSMHDYSDLDFDFKSYDNVDLWKYDQDIQKKLLALDSFRAGDIEEAFDYLNVNVTIQLGDDLEHLHNPPDFGSFYDWGDQLEEFMLWADRAADILEIYDV